MADDNSTDEFEGMGGSYSVDPKTGKRVLIDRTGEASEIQQPEPASEILKGEQ